MANISRPYGFRPVRYLAANLWTGASTLYAFSASQGNDCYKGDVVGVDTSNRMTAISDQYAPGIPYVLPKVAPLTTNTFRGVVAGFVAQPEFSQSATASLGTSYRQASTARYGWIVDDADVVFDVEESGNSYTSQSVNAVNKVVDIVYTAGNQTTGIAGVKMDATTVTTGTVKPFRVLRYRQAPDNFNFSATDTNSRAHFEVLIANSDLAQANSGA